MDVTYSGKRYISVCIGCDRLFDSVRSDQVCCGGTCRQRARRNGNADRIREAAELVTPSGLQQAVALGRLRPDLEPQIVAGSLEMREAMPHVVAAFDRLVWQAVR